MRANTVVAPLLLALVLSGACHLDSLLDGSSGGGSGGGGGGGGGGGSSAGLESLAQLQSDSTTLIPIGASVPDATIVVRAVVRDTSATATLRLEVEVRPVGTGFQNRATAAGDLVTSGARAYVGVTGLADQTAYHWQARVVTPAGDSTAWQAYGANAESAPDVRVAIPAASARLEFQTQPPSTTAGATMGAFKIAAVNGQGATITSFTGTVFLSVAEGPTGGAVDANATAVGGVATFSNVRMTTAGTYRLAAMSDGVAGATSTAFAINAAEPDHLVFVTEPSNTRPNQAIAPAVRVAVHDVYSNIVTSFTDVMFMNLGNDGSPLKNATLDPAGAHRAAAAGIATFEDLRIDQVGVGYTIGVSAAGTRGVTSRPFDVTP